MEGTESSMVACMVHIMYIITCSECRPTHVLQAQAVVIVKYFHFRSCYIQVGLQLLLDIM